MEIKDRKNKLASDTLVKHELFKQQVSEMELKNIQLKIDTVLSNLSDEIEEQTAVDECVICFSAPAIMQTFPCGHKVVCRRCFIKTIQMAVCQRCLPLRCVLCRDKILRLHHTTHHRGTTSNKPKLPFFYSPPLVLTGRLSVPSTTNSQQANRLSVSTTINFQQASRLSVPTTIYCQQASYLSVSTKVNSQRLSNPWKPGRQYKLKQSERLIPLKFNEKYTGRQLKTIVSSTNDVFTLSHANSIATLNADESVHFKSTTNDERKTLNQNVPPPQNTRVYPNKENQIYSNIESSRAVYNPAKVTGKKQKVVKAIRFLYKLLSNTRKQNS